MNAGIDSLLTISNLKTHFFFDEGVVKAVDDVFEHCYYDTMPFDKNP